MTEAEAARSPRDGLGNPAIGLMICQVNVVPAENTRSGHQPIRVPQETSRNTRNFVCHE
ncbi:hypothetical protein [Streptomyces sp. NPDC001492]